MNKTYKKQKFTAATTCAGCPIGVVARTVLNATDDPIVVTNATGCMEVTSTIYPNTSWKVPYIHSVFGNAGATASGIEAAVKSLSKQGKVDEKVKVIAFAGDGGTYDIGFQALSGALERGHDFLYVCYDNGAYMNTGNQRSGATPLGASTQTTPFGKEAFGKQTRRKDIMTIVAGHHVPYAATANIGFLEDFKAKVKKALAIKGPKFILVFSPCVALWKFPPAKTFEVAKLGTETNFWPLYEIENGHYKFSYEPKKRKPIEEFYGTQGRFKHIFKRDDKEALLQKIQKEIDDDFARIKATVESHQKV
ncbi:pyruvate ferredoxin oxidoreductase [bacterium]|jgi:pyruvate ferredoxin oxidoreductase beta subunit|nr:pyruvate ferredoxin oxidoreductase [bacterium]MBT4251133.1 pyruvate ferredoxin oxidoreductase [bacterium]MBT4598075.1 pyruvate ferredoxin oxidoreductase [bacterium]MBT6753418.1 pyruvate ferredoxin oxidoreductase [bacterium]MBT7038131.1 pyruvate ferredoxin oxidoreductase [bacterium]